MRIAISGAGVAGSTLAHWLQRSGHSPTLIERAPRFRTGGYMIDFWGVGYSVAQRMGIEAAVRDIGYQVRSVRSVGRDGQIQADLRADAFRRISGNRFTSLPRGDLAAVIYATIEHDVETIFGDTVTGIMQRADGVRLTFECSEPREFDLVIGADGLHSNVRQLVFGPESNFEHYLGCKVAACVVEGYRPRDELVYVTYAEPGRQVGRFSLRDDRTLFLFVFRADRIGDEAPTAKALLRSEFSDSGWECPRIIAALDDVDDIYFDVVSQIRMDRWSQGRAVLIGDAAACVSLLAGEGTGLGMTAAYVLAGELKCADGDYRRAFEVYEARLRPFIKGKQTGAQKLISFFATRTRFGIWIRNLAMRTMNFEPLANLFAGRSVRDEFDLPDYRM